MHRIVTRWICVCLGTLYVLRGKMDVPKLLGGGGVVIEEAFGRNGVKINEVYSDQIL